MTHSTHAPDRVPVFSLGERIRKVREDMGLSQQQLAVRLGVDRKTVGNWEGERNTPRYRDLMMISSVADISLEWLAGDLYRPGVSSPSNRECLRSPRPFDFESNHVADPFRAAEDKTADLLAVA